MADTPAFTVGILTVPGRENLLRRLAESLSEAVNHYDGEIRVLVAGESISDAEESLDEVLGCPVDGLETDGTAPSGRRRIVEAAQTEWVLFVDDDCRVDKHLLTEYATACQDAEDDIGAIYGPLVFEGRRSRAFEAFRFTPFASPLQIALWRDEVDWAPTANALFSRAAVRDVGNFDTDNPIAVSGEDVDIGLQLQAAGYNLETAPNAKVYHSTESWNGLVENISRAYTYGLSEAWLAQRYPDRTRPVYDFTQSMSSGQRFYLPCVLLCAILSAPLFGFVWSIVTIFRWIRTDPTTSLVSYAIADIYIAANYLGFIRQTLRGAGDIRQLGHRFEFYSHPHIHPRIREHGMWHRSDKN